MMKARRVFALAAAVAAVGFLSSACGGSSPGEGASSGEGATGQRGGHGGPPGMGGPPGEGRSAAVPVEVASIELQ